MFLSQEALKLNGFVSKYFCNWKGDYFFFLIILIFMIFYRF